MELLTQVDPALNLLRALQAGTLFTQLAEDMSGQPVRAEVERLGPADLFAVEVAYLGMNRLCEPLGALRRHGYLIQADGTKVARVMSVVATGRIPPEVLEVLTTTDTPLGRALGPGASRRMLWSSPGIDEHAVHSCAVVLLDGRPVALAVERVLWSWLDGLPTAPGRTR